MELAEERKKELEAIYQKFGGFIQYADLAEGEAVSGKCYYHKGKDHPHHHPVLKA